MWNSGSKCADSAIIKSRTQIAFGYSLTGNRFRPSKLDKLPQKLKEKYSGPYVVTGTPSATSGSYTLQRRAGELEPS